MLAILFITIVFFFLACGSVAFLLCLPRAQFRRRALSVALWFAMCGPCLVGLILLAGVGLIATALAEKAGDTSMWQAPRLISTFGWGYLTIGTVVSVGIASSSAWLHQWMTDRLPFFLFRLYATVVVAGIGSVFGWCIGLWRLDSAYDGRVSLVLWLLAMVILIVSFGFSAFKSAGTLRAPQTLFAEAPRL